MHLACHSWALLQPEAVAAQPAAVAREASRPYESGPFRLQVEPQGALLVTLPADSTLSTDLLSLHAGQAAGTLAGHSGCCQQAARQGPLCAT